MSDELQILKCPEDQDQFAEFQRRQQQRIERAILGRKETDAELETEAEAVPRCCDCRHFRWAKCELHRRIVDPDDTCKDHEEEVRSAVPHRAETMECFT